MHFVDRLAFDQQSKTLSGINLIAQKGSALDLADCYALHESLRIPYAERTRRILPEMWRILLSIGAMHLFVVYDRAQPTSSRIVSFNATVFVTDEFTSAAQLNLPPYLGVELGQRYLSNELPVLNREKVALANAREGLNVMMCFEGWTQSGFSPEQFLAVRVKQNEAFHLGLHGHRVKEFLAEPIGAETLQWTSLSDTLMNLSIVLGLKL